MKETRKHTDEEVARVMDTLAIAIRNKPAHPASNAASASIAASTSSSSTSSAVDAKKEEADQSSVSTSSNGYEIYVIVAGTQPFTN